MNSESYKELAVSFLRLAASGHVREAYERYVHPDFRHHNQYFRGDRQSLLLAMEENGATNPHKVLEVKRALEDGDLVAVHSHVRQDPAQIGAAVVHLFRFADGQIIELWDLGQPISPDSPNENGMF